MKRGQELLPAESINSCVKPPAKSLRAFHLQRCTVTLHVKIKGFNQSLLLKTVALQRAVSFKWVIQRSRWEA